MEYIPIGLTGQKVSRIGLGTWQFSEAWGSTQFENAKEIVKRALDHGINFFDTAMIYGTGTSETLLGKSLKEIGVNRDEVIISTKIPGDFLNTGDIYKAVEKSLRNLGLSYVDILLVHWPPCWHNFPTCEYANTLERLINLGKVNYLGLSDYPIELVEAFRWCLSKHDVHVLQVKYNLVERQAEKTFIPYAENNGMIIQAWSPIAKGALTGKYEPGKTEFQDVRSRDPIFHPENYRQVWEVVKLLREIGGKYSKKPLQVALNWLITSSPQVVPIPGAKTPDQVDDLVEAVEWRLDYSDWRLLEEASRKIDIIYSIHYLEKDSENRD